MSLFEVPNRSDEHVHAVPDAPLVHVERRRVVTRRVVGTDDEVRRQPALFLNPFHEERRVLARAEIRRREHGVDPVDALGNLGHQRL